MILKLSYQLDFFERCPLCSVARPLLNYKHRIVYYEHTIEDRIWFGWYLYQYTSRGGPISAQVMGPKEALGDANNPHFDKVNLTLQMLPVVTALQEAVPERVRRFLGQAINSMSAPDGAAMLANSAVDAMLKDRGLKDGSVYKRLGDAVSQGLITNEMREWADAIRVESNNPRHADEDAQPVSLERAKLLVEFAKALSDILFVLLAKARAQASEARSLTSIES